MSHNKVGHYDCVLEDADGNEIGLTLAKEKDEITPIYHESGDETLSQQMYVGLPDYAHSPPHKRIQIGQDDYRGGMGKEFESYLTQDSLKYYYAMNLDLRFRGMAIPGPLPVAVTKPGNISITVTNGDFETGDDTGWTNLDGVTDTTPHSGTYCGYELVSGSGETFYNTLTLDDTYKGRRITVTAYIRSSSANNVTFQVGIHDGTTTQWSSEKTPPNTGWTTITATATILPGATGAKIYGLTDGTGTGYWDDITITAQNGQGTLLCQAEFNDKQYIALGKCLCKLDSDGDEFTVIYEFAYTITCLEVYQYSGTDSLYIGQGSGHKYWYMSAAETFTESTVDNAEANFLKTISNSSGTALYLAELPNQIRKSTNPINDGSWEAPTYVGDAAKNITSLQTVDLSGDTFLVIIKEDSAYMLDNSGTPRPIIPQLKADAGTTTGKNSYVHGNALLVPTVNQSLWNWEKGEVMSLAPSEFINNASEFDGQVQAVTGDDRYVYVFVDNGDKVELLAGRWEDVNGEDWRWHGSLAELTLAGVEHAFVSSVYKKRLWVGSTNSAQNIYYIPLYTQYGNPATDADMAFQTGGYFVTDWRFANFRDDLKAFTRFNVQVDNVDATNYWTIYYEKWGDGAWTKIDDFGDDGVEIESAYIPVDGSGNKPQTQLIRYKIACTSDGAVPCPIFYHWTCDGIWYPSDKRKIISMQVRCADKLKIKKGIDNNQTHSQIKSFLNSAYSPSTAWPLNFYPPDWDADADTKTVKIIEPYDFFYTKIKKADGSTKYEGTFQLTLEEVTLS